MTPERAATPDVPDSATSDAGGTRRGRSAASQPAGARRCGYCCGTGEIVWCATTGEVVRREPCDRCGGRGWWTSGGTIGETATGARETVEALTKAMRKQRG